MGELAILGLPAMLAGRGSTSATVGGSLLGIGALGAWAAHNNQRPKIDPTKPIVPQLPGYVPPSSPHAEQPWCPKSPSPNDPRERCFNGVELEYATRMSRGLNPVLCWVNRQVGRLMCSAQRDSGGGGGDSFGGGLYGF